MKVNTTKYRASHWEGPRGKGYWFWQIGENEENMIQTYGTYSETREMAIKMARQLGAEVVCLLP